jgi:hypothetical protein
MQLQNPDLITAMQYFLKLFDKVPETSILIKLSFIWISLILVSGGIEVFIGKKVDSTFLYRNFQTFFLLFSGLPDFSL